MIQDIGPHLLKHDGNKCTEFKTMTHNTLPTQQILHLRKKGIRLAM